MKSESNVDVLEGSNTTIMKFMQSCDIGFKGFGEAYFSVVPCGVERNWKIHKKATCNIMVPYGKVLFVVAEYDLSCWSFVELGDLPQKRLTIPPMNWYGFLGVGHRESVIANIIDVRHEDEQKDDEQKRLAMNVPKAEVLWEEQTIRYLSSWK